MARAFVAAVDPAVSPVDALERFAPWPGAVLFHSALARPWLGRYSFLTADPLATVTVGPTDSATEAFRRVRALWRDAGGVSSPELPPFQGGVAGILCYEGGRLFEQLPRTSHESEWPHPLAMIGLYDWTIAWDHEQNRAWVIIPPLPSLRSAEDAQRRLRQILAQLAGGPIKKAGDSGAGRHALETPAFELPRLRGLVSNFDRDGYIRAVERVIRYIRAGDIFQANLSQRLSIPAAAGPVELYRRLVEVNPAPFAAYYDAGPYQVISASPERFLKVAGNEVETRPIKGTRGRRTVPEADLYTRDELRESDKDQAENVMIVDLLRNDLSRVCRPGSIRVPQLCMVESYETVTHLVSEVRGRLQEGKDFFDLLAATFPGGSITGAPKIRAMEIISELEQAPRGPYCGTLFYESFSGEADSSILIRTFTHDRGWLHFPVGGGITAQSDPAAEYVETLDKAEGLLRALEDER